MGSDVGPCGIGNSSRAPWLAECHVTDGALWRLGVGKQRIAKLLLVQTIYSVGLCLHDCVNRVSIIRLTGANEKAFSQNRTRPRKSVLSREQFIH